MNRKSFLRWAGSKRKLIPELQKYWGEGHLRYIEPFMGSAQLFFSLNPQKAILSDLNKELVEVFQIIQNNPYPIHKILSKLDTSKIAYYKIRDEDPRKLGKNQRAARFIYLNRLCFNGLYRTNSSGKFNVPYANNNISIINELDFLKKISEKLQNTKILCGDFQKIITQNIRKGDFVYLDPPYAVSNRKIFNQYGPSTFGTNDLERLSELVDFIDKKEAKFLLSYAYCKEIKKVFSKWDFEKTYTQRNIAGFAKHRRIEAEIFITNIRNEND